jgi:hypothetical protein
VFRFGAEASVALAWTEHLQFYRQQGPLLVAGLSHRRLSAGLGHHRSLTDKFGDRESRYAPHHRAFLVTA